MRDRKKGETHRQYNKALEAEIIRLHKIILAGRTEVNDFTTQNGLVPVTQYTDLMFKYMNLKERLMSYNLWTGE